MSTELQELLVKKQRELDALRAEYIDFAYIVSHELAAPFRQIEGFADIILSSHEDQFDDDTKRQFGYIINGSKTGSAIVNSLSAYSQLCAQELQVTSVDCNMILDDVTTRLSSLIGDTKAQYSCTELPVIMGDNGLINRLFYQLVHNALHYHAPDTQPVISVEAVEKEDSWEFCVKDNGIGMSDKQVEKVFKIFKRAVSEKKYSGSGVGLAISKQIVIKHEGKIWIQNNEGDGCSCYFTLPK